KSRCRVNRRRRQLVHVAVAVLDEDRAAGPGHGKKCGERNLTRGQVGKIAATSAGSESGQLDDVFEELAENEELDQRTKNDADPVGRYAKEPAQRAKTQEPSLVKKVADHSVPNPG